MQKKNKLEKKLQKELQKISKNTSTLGTRTEHAFHSSDWRLTLLGAGFPTWNDVVKPEMRVLRTT